MRDGLSLLHWIILSKYLYREPNACIISSNLIFFDAIIFIVPLKGKVEILQINEVLKKQMMIIINFNTSLTVV